MKYIPLAFGSLLVLLIAIIVFNPPAVAQSWGTPDWYNPKPTINCTSTTYGGVTTTTCR